MTNRDFLWAIIGFWCATALFVFSVWWLDVKTGVKAVVEVEPSAILEKVEGANLTHSQLRELVEQGDAQRFKQIASLERRMKQLEQSLAAQVAMIEQYKGQQQMIVASQSTKLPAPQLIQLAKEMGFSKVEAKP